MLDLYGTLTVGGALMLLLLALYDTWKDGRG